MRCKSRFEAIPDYQQSFVLNLMDDTLMQVDRAVIARLDQI
jgi:hypothetical protein